MEDEKKTTTIRDVNSTCNDIGIHIGQHKGNLNVIGGKFSNGKVGIMIGGNPADVVGSTSESQNSVVNIHGDVNAPLNVATGKTASISSLTIGEIFSMIDSSSGSDEQKMTAKSKFKEFIAHPLVTSIVGSIAGGITSGIADRLSK